MGLLLAVSNLSAGSMTSLLSVDFRAYCSRSSQSGRSLLSGFSMSSVMILSSSLYSRPNRRTFLCSRS